jgi:putative membrane protein
MWRELQRWRGVILIGLAVVATVWLAWGNQLVLYIHPRYIVFTVAMALVAVGLVVASVLARPGHDDDDEQPRGLPRLASGLALGLAGAAAVALIALPPATLTSATASQRDINSTTVAAEVQSVDEADASGATAGFTVLDWQSLLRQTSDLSFYSGKPVDVVGFITADADDPQNVFYVSRFVVTCCAVDAQPTGIPVYLENWQSSFAADQWVRVTGEFGTNPSARSQHGIALEPADIEIVEQPGEPYLF